MGLNSSGRGVSGRFSCSGCRFWRFRRSRQGRVVGILMVKGGGGLLVREMQSEQKEQPQSVAYEAVYKL